MAHELLADAGVAWSAIERIAVGLGPGHVHRPARRRGHRSRARAVADAELVGVSSLRALAAAALAAQSGQMGTTAAVLAVIDARRGEAFAAAYELGARGTASTSLPPRARSRQSSSQASSLKPKTPQVGEPRRWLAVGDGAVRFRSQLEARWDANRA